MNKMTLRRPDDWHVHLRDGDMLRMALPWTARAFGRAIVMPNLDPPVTTASQAVAYRDWIRRVLPDGSKFEPLMTCFLTDETDSQDVARGFTEEAFTAIKIYPARSTTNFAAGVTMMSDMIKPHQLARKASRMAEPIIAPKAIHSARRCTTSRTRRSARSCPMACTM